MTNACRHAAANIVVVKLEVDDDRVRLEVRDDGVGFDPMVRQRKSALGLAGMEERALSLAGDLVIESASGRGTVLRFTCPTRSPSAMVDR